MEATHHKKDHCRGSGHHPTRPPGRKPRQGDCLSARGGLGVGIWGRGVRAVASAAGRKHAVSRRAGDAGLRAGVGGVSG